MVFRQREVHINGATKQLRAHYTLSRSLGGTNIKLVVS